MKTWISASNPVRSGFSKLQLLPLDQAGMRSSLGYVHFKSSDIMGSNCTSVCAICWH